MFQKIEINKLFFFNTETVKEKVTYDELSDTEKEFFAAKIQHQRSEEQTSASFNERAGIWAEYGKIVCISVAFFNLNSNLIEFIIKSFYGVENEPLIDFKNLLEQCFNRHGHLHCAHNGKEIHFINIKSPVDIQVVLRLRNEALLMAQEIFHS
jgi:hypothetical protein